MVSLFVINISYLDAGYKNQTHICVLLPPEAI